MKNIIKIMVAMLTAAFAFASCNMLEETTTMNDEIRQDAPMTKAYGDNPIAVIYVETNDVNPLNAGDYMLSDGTPFAGIVEFFASNVHKRTVNGVDEPTLHLNQELTNLLENDGYKTYVQGLQAKGIKVLLTVLNDWQHIGLASMNDVQATQFAQILAHAVERYGLDGIGFDDEYADYNSEYPVNGTSYSKIITELHRLMPADKLITVFDWGNTGTLNAEAKACIDYSYHGYFGTSFRGSGLLSGSRWSPVSLNMGYSYSASTVKSLASRTKASGNGAFMFFNLRTRGDRNPQTVFNAFAQGAYGKTVTCSDGNRPQDQTFVPGGFDLTMDHVNGK